MRLLCVGNRYPPWATGGYETVFSGAVLALRAAGHRARVLSTVPDPSDRPSGQDREPDVHRHLHWYWRDHAFPQLGMRACVSLERANACTLRRHLVELAPDAVIWWAMGGMSLSLLAQVRRAEVPAVGVVGDDWMLYGPEVDRWTRRWRRGGALPARLAERSLGVPARLDLDRGAHWMFGSEYLRTSARGAGWRLPDAMVAHHGIDPQRFGWNEPGRWRWRLLYCGRLDPRKGIATAIEALALLPAQATLRIHGDGDPRHAAELAALAAELGVSDRVRFQRSDLAEVAACYAEADAVLFPVRWREPWGLVPLEAMAVGRPVIASRAGGGAAEYLEEERNCLQFEPGDAASLAAAVRRLAGEQELRASLREGGRATAARFDDHTFHESLERELCAAVRRGIAP
ncbi:MAG: glycosyltransferase family 4 protein [Solirubrobacteraceae bacterium]